MLNQSTIHMRPQNSMQRSMVLRKGELNLRLLSIQEKLLASTTSQSLTENSTKTRSAAAGTKSCMHCEVYDDVVADTAELTNCAAATPMSAVAGMQSCVRGNVAADTTVASPAQPQHLQEAAILHCCHSLCPLCNEGTWHTHETEMAAGLSHACCWLSDSVMLCNRPLSEQGAHLYPRFPAMLLCGKGRHR